MSRFHRSLRLRARTGPTSFRPGTLMTQSATNSDVTTARDDTGRPRVIVVGAGFAGLNVVKRLKNAPLDVLLIDQHNHHTFQPLLYQVATAQLEAGDVAHQVRAVLRGQANARFLQATVSGVDWDARLLELANGDQLAFDELVVAPGAIYADFGVPGVREHAHFLKSLSESVNLRSHVLRRFEEADRDPSAIDRGALTFVVVGGGPTGVEMAGALAELIHRSLPADYPHLDLSRARIVLLEMTDTILAPFSAGSQRHARKVLERRGVEVRTGASVEEVHADSVRIAGEGLLPAGTVVWAAGVQAHPLAAALGVETTRGGRIVVEPDLSLPGRPYAWAAGDAAASKDDDGALHPQLAPVAIQHGKHIAKNLRRRAKGDPTEPFSYFDKGTMAIIGKNAGIAEMSERFGGFAMRGFLGWLAWLFLHLVYLPGHRNRLGALVTWGYQYLTSDRHARLITDMVASQAERAGRTGQVPREQVPREQVPREEAEPRAVEPTDE